MSKLQDEIRALIAKYAKKTKVLTWLMVKAQNDYINKPQPSDNPFYDIQVAHRLKAKRDEYLQIINELHYAIKRGEQ